jgi:hypothetical protein
MLAKFCLRNLGSPGYDSGRTILDERWDTSLLHARSSFVIMQDENEDAWRDLCKSQLQKYACIVQFKQMNWLVFHLSAKLPSIPIDVYRGFIFFRFTFLLRRCLRLH